VLYEDENTNRMDEALILFEQICNHPSFKKTSMVLFLNKRDLFEMKLKKKNMTCWRDIPELQKADQDYDTNIAYLKNEFLILNKDPEVRQVYVHATCATDTNNVSFVMESVFDIILKDNLRKLATGNVESMLELASGTGVSGVAQGPKIWESDKQGKIILAFACYTSTLSERKVLTQQAGDVINLPAVQVSLGLSITTTDFEWIMSLGKDLPDLPVYQAEAGSFRGDFKEAAKKLRDEVGSKDLGFVYDQPVTMVNGAGARTTLIVCVKNASKDKEKYANCKGDWVDHEVFENSCYKKYDAKDTDATPCLPPPKNEEFNPFAANPVGYRWFKGITLFEAEAAKTPDKGVYLGIFKVLSTSEGFKVMVNEHNRIAIPMIFLTETQLDPAETKRMHGVRIREEKIKIDLLEGKQPNRGWLGPEMSGEEGATFPEKLWWAIDEAKARLDTDDLGKQYDKELLFIDEQSNIQLLLFGVLAKETSDVLPGHIWLSKQELQVQNMKYLCPTVLKGMLQDIQGVIDEIASKAATDSVDMATAAKLRIEKGDAVLKLKGLMKDQTPLKWIDRVIMWCADKMPSFGDGIDGASADEIVPKAMAKAADVAEGVKLREALIKKYAPNI